MVDAQRQRTERAGEVIRDVAEFRGPGRAIRDDFDRRFGSVHGNEIPFRYRITAGIYTDWSRLTSQSGTDTRTVV